MFCIHSEEAQNKYRQNVAKKHLNICSRTLSTADTHTFQPLRFHLADLFSSGEYTLRANPMLFLKIRVYLSSTSHVTSSSTTNGNLFLDPISPLPSFFSSYLGSTCRYSCFLHLGFCGCSISFLLPRRKDFGPSCCHYLCFTDWRWRFHWSNR